MADEDGTYHRDESDGARLDRHWNELLQELRVAQTGTQILFAFLLTIAFTTPFADSGDFTHTVFSITLILAALATGLLIAPVSFHRLVYQRRMRDRLVRSASAMAAGGLLLLMFAVAGGLLLALDMALPRTVAVIVASAVLIWFVGFWYVLPVTIRVRDESGQR